MGWSDPQHPIKAVLAARGITQTELARDLGFSQHFTNQVLNGRQPASPRFRRAAAEHLGVPETELFHLGDVERAVDTLLAQRAAQGLPPVVTNVAVLRRVAQVLANAADELEKAV